MNLFKKKKKEATIDPRVDYKQVDRIKPKYKQVDRIEPERKQVSRVRPKRKGPE